MSEREHGEPPHAPAAEAVDSVRPPADAPWPTTTWPGHAPPPRVVVHHDEDGVLQSFEELDTEEPATSCERGEPAAAPYPPGSAWETTWSPDPTPSPAVGSGAFRTAPRRRHGLLLGGVLALGALAAAGVAAALLWSASRPPVLELPALAGSPEAPPAAATASPSPARPAGATVAEPRATGASVSPGPERPRVVEAARQVDPTAEAVAPGSDPTAEAVAPGSDPTAEAVAPGADPTAEAVAPGSDPTAEAAAPGSDATAEAVAPGTDPTAEAVAPGTDPTAEAVRAPQSSDRDRVEDRRPAAEAGARARRTWLSPSVEPAREAAARPGRDRGERHRANEAELATVVRHRLATLAARCGGGATVAVRVGNAGTIDATRFVEGDAAAGQCIAAGAIGRTATVPPDGTPTWLSLRIPVP